MVVLTAKVDFKKIMLILGAAAALLLAVILFFGGSKQTFGQQDASGNDQRVAFLKSFGWDAPPEKPRTDFFTAQHFSLISAEENSHFAVCFARSRLRTESFFLLN